MNTTNKYRNLTNKKQYNKQQTNKEIQQRNKLIYQTNKEIRQTKEEIQQTNIEIRKQIKKYAIFLQYGATGGKQRCPILKKSKIPNFMGYKETAIKEK